LPPRLENGRSCCPRFFRTRAMPCIQARLRDLSSQISHGVQTGYRHAAALVGFWTAADAPRAAASARPGGPQRLTLYGLAAIQPGAGCGSPSELTRQWSSKEGCAFCAAACGRRSPKTPKNLRNGELTRGSGVVGPLSGHSMQPAEMRRPVRSPAAPPRALQSRSSVGFGTPARWPCRARRASCRRPRRRRRPRPATSAA
jgi:hypothetical protein